MVHDSLVIDFGDDDDGSKCTYGYLVEKDKTELYANEKLTIKVYAINSSLLSGITIYKEAVSLGNGVLMQTVESVTENIGFEGSKYSSVTYPISSITSANAATSLLTINNKQMQVVYTAGSYITLNKLQDVCVIANTSEDLYGSIDVTYIANKTYKQYVWTAPVVAKEISFPFFVLNNGEVLEIFNIKVKVDAATTTEVDVKFVVKDIANDMLIPNANITIYEHNTLIPYKTGISDSNGECIFRLYKGQTYDLKTIANNYIDSDKDYINNDTITIPLT